MPQSIPKKIIAIIVVLVVLFIVGTVSVIRSNSKQEPEAVVVIEEKNVPQVDIIGNSVEGRPLEAHTYGTGATHLVFVGGIHGGYEWNSVILSYTFIDYLTSHPEMIPKNLTITIIPSANPDGVHVVTGKEGRFTAEDVSTETKILESGRFNAHDVDINRNFDCKWKPESTWRSKKVNAGTEAFSEPEAKAIQNFMLKTRPAAVVFWHSKSNAVYASQCESGILEETLTIMNLYANASGYSPIKTFDAYEVTGAADDWLASIGIPAITVELQTHEVIEWEKNMAGIKALIEHYTK